MILRGLLTYGLHLMRPSELVRTESMRRHNAFRELADRSGLGATSPRTRPASRSRVNDQSAKEASASLLPRRAL
jgi:hypothetical protein